MSLLNKNNKDIKKIARTEDKRPTDTYNPNDVYTVSSETKKAETDVTTSIRLSVRNRNKLKAFVAQGQGAGVKSVDQVLDMLIDNYTAHMKPEEKQLWEIFYQTYSK